MPKEWINTKQAAEIIGCTPRHAWYLAKEGKFGDDKSQKVGRDYIIDKASAEKYAKDEDARKTGPRPKK